MRWAECALIGRSRGKLGCYTVHDPVHRGYNQSQRTRFDDTDKFVTTTTNSRGDWQYLFRAVKNYENSSE